MDFLCSWETLRNDHDALPEPPLLLFPLMMMVATNCKCMTGKEEKISTTNSNKVKSGHTIFSP